MWFGPHECLFKEESEPPGFVSEPLHGPFIYLIVEGRAGYGGRSREYMCAVHAFYLSPQYRTLMHPCLLDLQTSRAFNLPLSGRPIIPTAAVHVCPGPRAPLEDPARSSVPFLTC